MIRTSVPVPFGGFRCMTLEENRKNNPVHKLIKLDKEDRHLLKEHSFSFRSKGGKRGIYVRTSTGGKDINLHNLILPKKEGFVVDHVNRNTLDNRRCNLRYATRSQNCMNKKMKQWRASIFYNNRSIHLGFFSNKKNAARKVKREAKELFGEYCGEF